MTGQDGHVVSKREDFLSNAPEKQVAIATWEVPSSNSAGEEHISAEENVLRLPEKAEVSRRVSWNVQDLELQTLQRGAFGLIEMHSVLYRFNFPAEAKLPEEVLLSDHRHGFRMIRYFAGVLSLDPRRIPDVIDVTMGQKHQFYVVTAPLEPFGRVLWGVDQDVWPRQKEAVGVKDSTSERIQSLRCHDTE
jgi:hypothetical protein